MVVFMLIWSNVKLRARQWFHSAMSWTMLGTTPMTDRACIALQATALANLMYWIVIIYSPRVCAGYRKAPANFSIATWIEKDINTWIPKISRHTFSTGRWWEPRDQLTRYQRGPRKPVRPRSVHVCLAWPSKFLVISALQLLFYPSAISSALACWHVNSVWPWRMATSWWREGFRPQLSKTQLRVIIYSIPA